MHYPSTLIVKKRGGGKSVTARALAESYHNDGIRIVTNMTMYGLRNYHQMRFSEMKDQLTELFDCVLIIDEGQKGLNAFDYFRKDVRKFNDWLSELRKRRVTLFLITQHPNKVTKKFREDVDYMMIPNKLTNDVYRVDVFDLSMPEGDDFVRSFFFNGNEYYDLYNTEELLEE